MIYRSQQRRGAFNGTRIMAGLALLLSFLAFLMAGIVMLRTGPEGGGIKANLESFRAEASRVIGEIRDRFRGDETPATAPGGEEAAAAPQAGSAESPQSTTPEEGDEGFLELDRIRERVDEIEGKVLSDDGTAGDTLDELKEDLARLKDFSKDDARELLDRISDSLTSARKSIAEDSSEAARRLRALSEDLVRRSREQTRHLRTQPESTPEPTPES
jgi:hypothetical protein